MRTSFRRQLSMAERSLAFERDNPAADPVHVALVDKVATLLGEVHALHRAAGVGDDGERLARARRTSLRRRIRPRLQHLSRVARMAEDTARLQSPYRAPDFGAPNQEFIAIAARYVAMLPADLEALTAAGLGAGFLEALTTLVEEYQAQSGVVDERRGDHVRSRASLEAMLGEALSLLRVLDGLNAIRFAEEPGLLAEWRSARNVFGPVTRTATEPPPAAAA